MIERLGLGLRAKLVITVVTGVVICISAIGAFRLYQAKLNITDEINRSGQERATLIAEALSDLIVGYDYSNMESLAERIVQFQDVHQITIRNKTGKIMVSRKSHHFKPTGKGLSFEAPVLFSGEHIGSVTLRVSLERLDETINNTYRNIIIALSLFAAFLSLLIYIATSRVIVKPIGHFRDLMNSILNDPSGTSKRKLEITSQDEIGELAAIFNSMNNKVNDYQQRLQDKYSMADSALVATNEQLKARTIELEKAFTLVEQLATTDSLTNLPNRRHFDDYLSMAFPRSIRFNEPLSLVLLDIDYFKQINDQNGHAAGDYVLQELGKLLKARTRETDSCARIGGDEFALLLYRTTSQEALTLTQDLMRIIREHIFTMNNTTLTVSLSIGIAERTADTPSIEALYGAADKALYEAKRLGRNQAVAYPFNLAV